MMEHWFDLLVTAFMGLIGWFGIRLWDRMDKVETRQHAMQLACMTRDDFHKSMTDFKADRAVMHDENKSDLKDIKGSVAAVQSAMNQIAVTVAALPRQRPRS